MNTDKIRTGYRPVTPEKALHEAHGDALRARYQRLRAPLGQFFVPSPGNTSRYNRTDHRQGAKNAKKYMASRTRPQCTHQHGAGILTARVVSRGHRGCASWDATPAPPGSLPGMPEAACGGPVQDVTAPLGALGVLAVIFSFQPVRRPAGMGSSWGSLPLLRISGSAGRRALGPSGCRARRRRWGPGPRGARGRGGPGRRPAPPARCA